MLPLCFATKGTIRSQITKLVVSFGITMGLMMVPSAYAQDSNPFNVWDLQGNRDDGSTKVKINHAGLIAALAAGEPLVLSFILPDDVFECTVAPSQLMAPELQSKYPEIKVFVGQCSQDGSAIVVVNENEANSMSATLYNSFGDVLYVDHNIGDDNPETYTIVDKQNVVLPEGSSWSDSVIHGRRLGQNPLNPSNRSLQNKELEGKIYRTAIGTTREFSQRYGDTRESVLLQVVKAMARVNGIYLREVGVMFQLIANTDDLFCVNGVGNCSYLNNGNAGGLIEQATDYITNVRGISIASFDLGHIFSTSGNGIASLGGVCDDTYKARGVTGLDTNRDEEIFFVDYLSHEVSNTAFVVER